MGTSLEWGNLTFWSNMSFCATTDKLVTTTIYLYDLTTYGNLQIFRVLKNYFYVFKSYKICSRKFESEEWEKNLLRLSNLSLCAAPVLVSLGNLWLSALSQSSRGPLRNNSPKKLLSQISPLVPCVGWSLKFYFFSC